MSLRCVDFNITISNFVSVSEGILKNRSTFSKVLGNSRASPFWSHRVDIACRSS